MRGESGFRRSTLTLALDFSFLRHSTSRVPALVSLSRERGLICQVSRSSGKSSKKPNASGFASASLLLTGWP